MSKTTEPESVWIISSGEYSDYSVLAVVKGGKKAAKSLAARANAHGSTYTEYRVEELPVVDADVERVEILTLTAEIRDAGPSVKEERDPYYRVEWPFDALYGAPSVSWRWVRAPIHQGRGGRLEVHGVDHERVRKVYSERKAMLLADDAFRAKQEAKGGASQ